MSTRGLKKLQAQNVAANLDSTNSRDIDQSKSKIPIHDSSRPDNNYLVPPLSDEISDDQQSGSVEEISERNRFDFLEDEPESDTSETLEPNNSAAMLEKKVVSTKKKNKNKKKAANSKQKPQKQTEIDTLMERILADNVVANTSSISGCAEMKLKNNNLFLAESDLFRIEYRNLHMENELKRMFGKAVGASLMGNAESGGLERVPLRRVQRANESGGGASSSRGGTKAGGGRLVISKNDVRISKTGLSMVLVKQPNALSSGANLFKFEHNQAYQTAQHLFWDAVETMNPELFLAILREHPFHIDTLLQMSEIYIMNEDFGTSRDLVERAISACQAAFHPLFNVALNNSRLEYRQRENRPFFLALNKHLQFMCQKSCFRTALEFCKLIYSLDPEQDPLGMLLYVDYLCLRSKQYDYLINFFYLLEAKRNLSQLPNFCFSLALALYFKSINNNNNNEDPTIREKADNTLKEAITKFPTLLPLLLEKCGVEPDKKVLNQEAFNFTAQAQDGQGLEALYHIYVNRCYMLWKQQEILKWLEDVVHGLIDNGNLQNGYSESNTTKESLYKQYCGNRILRYKTTPMNVCRHAILGGQELASALTFLPEDIKHQAIRHYDPVPPPDTLFAYDRKVSEIAHGNNNRGQHSLLRAFLHSLLPNYNPEANTNDEAVAAAAGNQEDAEQQGGTDFQQSVQAVLRAMQDLLADIQPAPADRENENGHPVAAAGDPNEGGRAAAEPEEDDEWADDLE